MILMRHSDVDVHCIFTTGTANSALRWLFVGRKRRWVLSRRESRRARAARLVGWLALAVVSDDQRRRRDSGSGHGGDDEKSKLPVSARVRARTLTHRSKLVRSDTATGCVFGVSVCSCLYVPNNVVMMTGLWC